MFEELGLSIKQLAAEDPSSVDDETLDSGIAELARWRNQLEAVEAQRLAVWDRRRLWAEGGARSAAAELAWRTKQPLVECKRRLALARSLAKLPVAAEAWSAGDITGEHVRVLARACNARTETLMARDEPTLVAQAKELTFSHFARAVAYWSHHADPDGTSQRDLERREERHLSIGELPDGVALSGLLDPIGGETVTLELARIEQQLFDADWAEARLRVGREPLASDLRRTSGQRRADALVEMAVRSAGSKKRGKPLFTVLLGEDTFARMCELEHSRRVLPPSALAEWMRDGLVEGVLFEAGTREIKISRKRRFTGALRRLLEVRDRECFHRTCEEPPEHCQGDHIEPYSLGGLTSPGNGRLGCGFHNRGRHHHPRRRRPPPPD